MVSMKSQRGSIIAFSLIVLSLLLTSGLTLVTVAVAEKKAGLATQKSVLAFQAADSGAERMLKNIYTRNSPSLATTALNARMPDRDLSAVAGNLDQVSDPSCNGAINKIVATNSSAPSYTLEVSLFAGDDSQIACNDNQWRDKVVRIRAEGFYRQTSRVVEMGVKPRKQCAAGDTVDDTDGNTYDVIQIGDQCWMRQNMLVGRLITWATPPTNDGSIEKFCYNDNINNCTRRNPPATYPDGGLYMWDEAMDYAVNEGARGICASLGDGSSWHIPSDGEWYTLEHYLDATINNPTSVGFRGTDAGTKMKSGGGSGFEFNINGYSNSSYTGRWNDGINEGYIWTSTSSTLPAVYMRAVKDIEARIWRGTINSLGGRVALAVRCVHD